jgi:hypothetical protein
MTGYERGPRRPGDRPLRPPPDPQAGETLKYDVDGVEVEVVVEVRCLLCTAPGKGLPNAHEVNVAVLEAIGCGVPCAGVWRQLQTRMLEWLPEDRLSRTSFYRHAEDHLPADVAAMREIADRRWKRTGQAATESPPRS